jgi:hypothetical protein
VASSLTSIALDVAAQASRLRSLADSSWTGSAATAARSRTATLPPMLDKAHASYATAGGALSSYARSLASAQSQSVAAIARAARASADLAASRTAQSAAAARDATAASAARAALLPPPVATAPRFAGAIEEAAASLRAAYALNADAHDSQDQAARAAASTLQQASHLAIRNASWMHRVTHAVSSWAAVHWVQTLRLASHAGQLIAAGAGIAALVLAVGGVFFPPLLAFAAIAETASMTGAAIAAVADTTLAASGNGSWTTVGIDAVSLAPAGLGRVVKRFGPVLKEGFINPKSVVHASTVARNADGSLLHAVHGLYGADGIAADGTHITWGREDDLARHVRDHGTDFGAMTEDEYVDQGHAFMQEGLAGHHPTMLDAPKGVVRFYDPLTERFGAYNRSGTTRTFFRPDPLKHHRADNWAYFLSQGGVRIR